MMQVSVTVTYDPQKPELAASQLRLFATRLDGYTGKAVASAPCPVPAPAPAPEHPDAEPKKRGRKPKEAAAVEPEYNFGAMETPDDEAADANPFNELAEAEKPKVAKAKAAKPITQEDVSKALFAFIKRQDEAGNKGRQLVIGVLQMFGVSNPKDLKSEDYADFIEEMNK